MVTRSILIHKFYPYYSFLNTIEGSELITCQCSQVWMFQRFTVVMEYEQKPVLPPPLILFCHVYLMLKFLRRKVQGVQETYDNGLKLFLDSEDLERLYDFEEECVEGYFREKDSKLHMSTEERIKMTTERVENMFQKVEDINQKENSQQSSIQVGSNLYFYTLN